MNKSGQFYNGYTAIDDPYHSTNVINEFRNFNFDDSGGHLDITVPISKGDSMWFRMSPQDESGGYYAVMSNLKVSLLSS